MSTIYQTLPPVYLINSSNLTVNNVFTHFSTSDVLPFFPIHKLAFFSTSLIATHLKEHIT